jgi:hypothetical protein
MPSLAAGWALSSRPCPSGHRGLPRRRGSRPAGSSATAMGLMPGESWDSLCWRVGNGPAPSTRVSRCHSALVRSNEAVGRRGRRSAGWGATGDQLAEQAMQAARGPGVSLSTLRNPAASTPTQSDRHRLGRHGHRRQLPEERTRQLHAGRALQLGTAPPGIAPGSPPVPRGLVRALSGRGSPARLRRRASRAGLGRARRAWSARG